MDVLRARFGLLQPGLGQAPSETARHTENSLQEAVLLEIAMLVGYQARIEAPA